MKNGEYNNKVKLALDIELVKENGHTLLSEYSNVRGKVEIDFNCGHSSHLISPNHYRRGRACPLCSESKGEKIIRKYLEKSGVIYQSQFSFPEESKRYNFLLPKDKIIVEIHNIQHYEDREYFKSSLEENKLNNMY